MKKELKRQIKQDDLLTGLDLVVHWIRGHLREVQIALVAALALAAAAFGLSYMRDARAQEAEKAFAEALASFHAPLEAELSAGAPRPALVFKTAEEKFRKAAGQFDGIERRYASLAVGREARYYGAVSRIEMGAFAEAEKALKEQAGSGGLEASLARLALAEGYQRSGKPEQALEAYRQMVDAGADSLPKDHVLDVKKMWGLPVL